jgi:cell division control protein 42
MTCKVKVVVSDGAVCKTCLLMAYKNHEIPSGYVPTIFDNHVVQMRVHNKDVTLQLWDSAGQEEFENIRVLSYTNKDVFAICFSLVNLASLVKIQSMWLPGLKRHIQNPRFILVGTKKNLRENKAVRLKLSHDCMRPVLTSEGQAKAAEMKAYGYVECAAMQQDRINEVFDLALTCALKRKKKKAYLLLERLCVVERYQYDIFQSDHSRQVGFDLRKRRNSDARRSDELRSQPHFECANSRHGFHNGAQVSTKQERARQARL